jgi:subtilisin
MTTVVDRPTGSLRRHITRAGDGEAQRFVLLPPAGLWGQVDDTDQRTRELFGAIASAVVRGSPVGVSRTGTIREEVGDTGEAGLCMPLAQVRPPEQDRRRGAIPFIGPALVELDPEALLALRRLVGAVRVVPEQSVLPMTSLPAQAPTRAPGTSPVTIEVLDSLGHPVDLAEVQAFTNVRLALGDQGTTDATGTVVLALDGPNSTIERLYVRPDRSTYRGHFSAGVVVSGTATHTVVLEALDLTIMDGLRHRYTPNALDGTGVRVAILDSGVDLNHPDLSVAGGLNTVYYEDESDYGDNGGSGHGTHVAGIIAANPAAAGTPWGVAPGAEIFSYRIYAKGAQSPHGSFAILNAAIQAAGHDRCDLLNMSFGVIARDALFDDMDRYIRSKGALAFAAAGNTNRGAVTVPAALDHVVAVAALGRRGTYPASSIEEADECAPFGTDADDYAAAFSPDSVDIVLAAPGVGILSTLPGRSYGAWSGTSQACAAATGRAATVLAASGHLANPGDAQRAALLWNAVLGSAQPLGLGLRYEGGGVMG